MAVDRRVLLRAAVLTILAGPRPIGAQSTGPWRVGYLAISTGEAALPFTAALEEGLHKLGEIDGRRIVVAYRFAAGEAAQLPVLADQLVRLPVDVIVAALDQAVVAARRATATVPIVMVGAGDPVGRGLIASLDRPGGNVTGLTLDTAVETWARRLQLLKEIAPGVARVGVLRGDGEAGPDRGKLEAAVQPLRIALDVVEVREGRELPAAFETMKRRGVDGLLVAADPVVMAHRREVIALAARYRLPAVYPFAELVDSGGLMSYGPNVLDLYRRAAVYVGRLLRGARPAELPVEPAAQFELAISLPAARAAALSLPASVLIRADHLIE